MGSRHLLPSIRAGLGLGLRTLALLLVGTATAAGGLESGSDSEYETPAELHPEFIPRIVDFDIQEACEPLAIGFDVLLRVDPDYEEHASGDALLAGSLDLQVTRGPASPPIDLPVGDIVEGQVVTGEVGLELVVADLGFSSTEVEFFIRARVDIPDGQVVLVSDWMMLSYDCAPLDPASIRVEVEVLVVRLVPHDPGSVFVQHRHQLHEASFQNIVSIRVFDDRLDFAAWQSRLDAALFAAHGVAYLPAGETVAFETQSVVPLSDFDLADDGSRSIVHRTTVVGIGDNTGEDLVGSATTTVLMPASGGIDNGESDGGLGGSLPDERSGEADWEQGGSGPEMPGEGPGEVDQEQGGSGPGMPSDEPSEVPRGTGGSRPEQQAGGGDQGPTQQNSDEERMSSVEHVLSTTRDSHRDAGAGRDPVLVQTGVDITNLAVIGLLLVVVGIVSTHHSSQSKPPVLVQRGAGGDPSQTRQQARRTR